MGAGTNKGVLVQVLSFGSNAEKIFLDKWRKSVGLTKEKTRPIIDVSLPKRTFKRWR